LKKLIIRRPEPAKLVDEKDELTGDDITACR
jgi:hypothetical protein